MTANKPTRSAETALSDGNEEVAELSRARLQRARLHERSRARDGSFNGSFSGDDLTDLWREVHNGYEALAPYRDEVLEQWHRKAQLASGASVLLGKGYNTSGTNGSGGNARGGGIAAGIMNQVRAVMGDAERMRKRSFMRAALTNVLGRVRHHKRRGGGAKRTMRRARALPVTPSLSLQDLPTMISTRRFS